MRQHESDPAIDAIVAAVSDSDGARAVLVAGAPGFGKSSVLAAVGGRLRRKAGTRVVWIGGGIVASEAHLVALVAEAIGRPDWANQPLRVLCESISSAGAGITLAIDDFDALVFKREALSATIGKLLAQNPSARLIATCRPSTRDRFLNQAHPFFVAAEGRLTAITLQPMDSETALALIRRRAPRLPLGVAHQVIQAAAGHPAALVFLARLAELRRSDEEGDLSLLFERAAEFAGAVYSESWASLGPQQRAVLWELSARPMATAADVASGIHLPASHVSAQITRLVADGLVRREKQRGHYSVAPLLVGWIARRAARNERTASEADQRIDVVEMPHDLMPLRAAESSLVRRVRH